MNSISEGTHSIFILNKGGNKNKTKDELTSSFEQSRFFSQLLLRESIPRSSFGGGKFLKKEYIYYNKLFEMQDIEKNISIKSPFLPTPIHKLFITRYQRYFLGNR